MFRKISIVATLFLLTLGTVAVATAEDPKAGGGKQITNSIGMKLILIPSGEFMMGSGESAEETAVFFNKLNRRPPMVPAMFQREHPQHRVRITKPFYLGTYHVTRGQFSRFIKDTGNKTDAERDNPDVTTNMHRGESWRTPGFEQTDDHPAVCISWNDAMFFCMWLHKKEGKDYRLPTEAEWEYACRAGTTKRYCNGDDPEKLVEVANIADAAFKAKFPPCTWSIKASDGYVYTSPVGKFKPNAFGLYDMHGNARQWCADVYDYSYYGASPTNDPPGPFLANIHVPRVVRGTGWGDPPDAARSAWRYGTEPQIYDVRMGFRVARTLAADEMP